MDTVTHALSGALLACATAPVRARPGELPLRTRIAAGFAAASFPDIDFALRLIDTLTYLNWHQGPTHSLVLLPGWAWLLAHAFARVDRHRHRRQAFFVPAALGLAIHIAGDLVTAYGLMPWAPLSARRFALPWVFVIDPWFTAILAFGLALALWRPAPQGVAAAALAVLAGYVMVLAGLHAQALRAGRAHVLAGGLGSATVHALPQPLSPLHWKIIVRSGSEQRVAHIRLPAPLGTAAVEPPGRLLRRIHAAYRPPATAPWVDLAHFGHGPDAALARKAWNAPAFEPFRRFAVFPAVDGIDRAGEAACVWFVDLRFTLPAVAPSFRFGACRDALTRAWQLRRSRGAWWID
jgi:inner membrane protein